MRTWERTRRQSVLPFADREASLSASLQFSWLHHDRQVQRICSSKLLEFAPGPALGGGDGVVSAGEFA